MTEPYIGMLITLGGASVGWMPDVLLYHLQIPAMQAYSSRWALSTPNMLNTPRHATVKANTPKRHLACHPDAGDLDTCYSAVCCWR